MTKILSITKKTNDFILFYMPLTCWNYLFETNGCCLNFFEIFGRLKYHNTIVNIATKCFDIFKMHILNFLDDLTFMKQYDVIMVFHGNKSMIFNYVYFIPKQWFLVNTIIQFDWSFVECFFVAWLLYKYIWNILLRINVT